MYQFPAPSAATARPLAPALAPSPAARRPAPRRLPRRGPALLAGMVGAAAVLALLLVATGIRVDLRRADVAPYAVACLAAAALRLGLAGLGRGARRVAFCAEYYATFMLIGLLGALASYPVAAASHGFHDAALQRVDAALRFDWLAWYGLVAAHPALQVAGRVAYESIYYIPALILGWFAWTDRRRAAHGFLAGFWIAAVLTLGLFHFMPAVGPLAYLWHGPVPYLPASALWQPELIPQLRLHAFRVVDLGELRGLVSAPSFHTAAGVLYIAGAWPHRALRWPVAGLSGLMLLATPVEGTHYLADMLAGAAVALTALGVVGWLERLPRGRWTQRRPGPERELAALLRRA